MYNCTESTLLWHSPMNITLRHTTMYFACTPLRHQSVLWSVVPMNIIQHQGLTCIMVGTWILLLLDMTLDSYPLSNIHEITRQWYFQYVLKICTSRWHAYHISSHEQDHQLSATSLLFILFNKLTSSIKQSLFKMKIISSTMI